MTTVRAKLLAFNIFIVAATLVGMGFALRARIHSNLLSEIDRDLASDTSSILVSHVQGPDQIHVPSTPGTMYREKVISPSEGKVVEVLRSNNSQVRMEASSFVPRLIPVGIGQSHIDEPLDSIGMAAAETKGRNTHDFVMNGQPTRSLSVPLYEGGKLIAVAQAIRPLAPMQRQMADLDRGLEMLIPFAVVISGLLGWALVGITIRPLRNMLESAKRLEPDLSCARLPVIGNDEFAQLAGTFNQAFDRTADAFQHQRDAIAQLERFTADAGHELRTPVAAIKGGTSFLLDLADLPEPYKKTARVMDRSADRMGKLIDDLLILSKQDAGQRLTMAPNVHLATIIEEARDELIEPECVRVQINIPEKLSLCADADALKRVFLNLLSNALAYASSCVKINAWEQSENIIVTIQDDGEGIAPEHLARLGERFYRPDSARARERGGTGLGLAISKSLCEAHDGTLQIESALGKGTKVQVTIPRCAQSS